VQASGTAPKQRQASARATAPRCARTSSSDRLGAVWWLTLAGLRRSEILALTWADVDLSAGTATVSRSITPDASGRRGAPTGTKTRSGARCLPLAGEVVALLSTLRAEHGAALGFEHIRSGFLAVDENGTPLRPERWSDMGRTHCQTAGVPVVTLHSARHTSVTPRVSAMTWWRRGMATTKRS
jgi:integrase